MMSVDMTSLRLLIRACIPTSRLCIGQAMAAILLLMACAISYADDVPIADGNTRWIKTLPAGWVSITLDLRDRRVGQEHATITTTITSASFDSPTGIDGNGDPYFEVDGYQSLYKFYVSKTSTGVAIDDLTNGGWNNYGAVGNAFYTTPTDSPVTTGEFDVDILNALLAIASFFPLIFGIGVGIMLGK